MTALNLNDIHMLERCNQQIFPVKYHLNDYFQCYIILFYVTMFRK